MTAPDNADGPTAASRAAPTLPSDSPDRGAGAQHRAVPGGRPADHRGTRLLGGGDPASRARATPDRRCAAARWGEGRAHGRRSVPRRHDRQSPALCHFARRRPPHRLPGRAALPDHRIRTGLSVPAGAGLALHRAVGHGHRRRGALPGAPGPSPRGLRPAAAGTARTAPERRGDQLSRRAGRSRCDLSRFRSRRKSRRSSRRSILCRGSTRSRACSPSGSRFCACPTRSVDRPRPLSTRASAR